MREHTDLWYTIGGEALSIQDLLPNDAAPSTPLHTIDSLFGAELFCNPWGSGSEIALGRALQHASDRASCRAQPRISLERAIEVIGELAVQLGSEAARGTESPLMGTYSSLKGVPVSEVRAEVSALGRWASELSSSPKKLRLALATQDPERFFADHSVVPRFGLIASGNLGLFESVTLIWMGILAQAARNGSQFSFTIKPSIYDFLFDWIIQLLPQDVRTAFSRVTWRSEEDILPDSGLMRQLFSGLDGTICFGNRRTLARFKNLVAGCSDHHYFYYDHFPVMILLSDTDPETTEAAARLAVELAYKKRGESCLSLQDVFVHKNVHGKFIESIIEEWRRIRAAEIKVPGSLLSLYSRAHLEKLAELTHRLSGAVIGRVYPQDHRTDVIINHEIPPDDWILATENAAPLLCVAQFSDAARLIEALRYHLQNSTSDRFIYSLIAAPEDAPQCRSLCDELAPISHRVKTLASARSTRSFRPFAMGTPHCGGISFLADIFGLRHRQTCHFG